MQLRVSLPAKVYAWYNFYQNHLTLFLGYIPNPLGMLLAETDQGLAHTSNFNTDMQCWITPGSIWQQPELEFLSDTEKSQGPKWIAIPDLLPPLILRVNLLSICHWLYITSHIPSILILNYPNNTCIDNSAPFYFTVFWWAKSHCDTGHKEERLY